MKIITFGIATDIIGKTEFDFVLEGSGITVGDIRQALIGKFPDLQKLRSMSFAVNERYAENDLLLNEKDVVALIPPVSGG